MLMNYHGMTMNEARDSPARRKQFLVITTVMTVFFVHGTVTSGVFSPLSIKKGIFPGGQFVYKLTGRDYAASPSMIDSIAEDLEIERDDYDDLMYTLYLDDPWKASGRQQRFACGILVDRKGADKKKTLMDMNEGIRELQKEDVEVDLPATKLWKRIEYESASLPRVDAAVVQFPYTGGFMSSLVSSYKIMPALLKYADEHGEPNHVPVVISTCSHKEGMCTHYVPLVKGKKFLMGQPDTETHLRSCDAGDSIEWGSAMRRLKKSVGLSS